MCKNSPIISYAGYITHDYEKYILYSENKAIKFNDDFDNIIRICISSFLCNTFANIRKLYFFRSVKAG